MRKLRNWLPLVALTLAPVIAGCGGGGSGSTSVVVASFTNGSAALSDQTDRNATLSLRARGNQRVEGTLTITTDPTNANRTRDTTNFVFPTGSFPVSGDYTPFSGETAYTAKGTFSTPSVQFTISGTFPSAGTAGTFTISGTYNGVAFSEQGAIPALNTPPTPTPTTATPSSEVTNPSSDSATLTLTGSSAGAGASFASTIGTFVVGNKTTVLGVQPTLTINAQNADGTRTFQIVLLKVPGETFQKGDVFPFFSIGQSGGKGNRVLYTYQPDGLTLREDSGSVTLTDITSAGFTFTVANLRLENNLTFTSGSGNGFYAQ